MEESRPTYNELEIHDSTSEMHRAISMRDKDWVKRLLDKGDKLCNGVDKSLNRGLPNCFILAQSVATWGFMKFLLSIDPVAGTAAKNHDGLNLLMLNAKDHNINESLHLLELGADPNERLSDGNTALMIALSKLCPPNAFEKSQRYEAYAHRRKVFGGKCQQFMDLLIQRGADVNMCNKNGENALHVAVKNQYTFQLEILQSLINAGIDPTCETKEHCTVLSYAMKTFLEICVLFGSATLAKEVYAALRYLFHLVQRDSSFQLHCEISMHPQVVMLKHLLFCQQFTEIPIQSVFVDLINSNLRNPELIVMDVMDNVNDQNPSHKLVSHAELPFGPVALYLNFKQLPGAHAANMLDTYSVLNNIQFLLSLGFSVNGKQQQTISPLTVGLLHQYPDCDYSTFAKSMVKNGVHVEQRMLKYEGHDEELERISAELCLPDALRVTLSQSHLSPSDVLELVKMFLPHFAHPPLTLLPFVSSRELVAFLFPLLSSYGGLQHTALHSMVKNRVLNSRCLTEQNLQTFNELNGCVPKLQEMCRTIVRAQLAQRACQHSNSLPELIKSAPPLNNLKIMAPLLE